MEVHCVVCCPQVFLPTDNRAYTRSPRFLPPECAVLQEHSRSIHTKVLADILRLCLFLSARSEAVKEGWLKMPLKEGKRAFKKALLHLARRLDRETFNRYSCTHYENNVAERHKESLCFLVQETFSM